MERLLPGWAEGLTVAVKTRVTALPGGKVPRSQVIWDPFTVPEGPPLNPLKDRFEGRLSVTVACWAEPPETVTARV